MDTGSEINNQGDKMNTGSEINNQGDKMNTESKTNNQGNNLNIMDMSDKHLDEKYNEFMAKIDGIVDIVKKEKRTYSQVENNTINEYLEMAKTIMNEQKRRSNANKEKAQKQTSDSQTNSEIDAINKRINKIQNEYSAMQKENRNESKNSYQKRAGAPNVITNNSPIYAGPLTNRMQLAEILVPYLERCHPESLEYLYPFAQNPKMQLRAGSGGGGTYITNDFGGIVHPQLIPKVLLEALTTSKIAQLATLDFTPNGITYVKDAITKAGVMKTQVEGTPVENSEFNLEPIATSPRLFSAKFKLGRQTRTNLEAAGIDLMKEAVIDLTEFYKNTIDKISFHGAEATDKYAAITGLTDAQQVVESRAADALTADDILALTDALDDSYQEKAVFFVNQATLSQLRMIKDPMGYPMLRAEKDLQGKWSNMMMGSPVIKSAFMEAVAPGKNVIYYGDMSNVLINIPKQLTITEEDIIDEYALRIHAHTVFDIKIRDHRGIVALKMKNAV